MPKKEKRNCPKCGTEMEDAEGDLEGFSCPECGFYAEPEYWEGRNME